MEYVPVMWPVLKCYRGKYLRQIAMPIGGIGTGTVSLGGRGNLQDWAIVNNPAIGYTLTMMEGILDSVDFEGAPGSQAPNHGLTRL